MAVTKELEHLFVRFRELERLSRSYQVSVDHYWEVMNAPIVGTTTHAGAAGALEAVLDLWVATRLDQVHVIKAIRTLTEQPPTAAKETKP